MLYAWMTAVPIIIMKHHDRQHGTFKKLMHNLKINPITAFYVPVFLFALVYSILCSFSNQTPLQ